MPRPRTFLDDDLEDRLERRGYVTVPFLSAAEVADVRAAQAAIPRIDSDAMAISYAQGTPQIRRAAADALHPMWRAVLGRILADHEVVLTSFAVKPPGPASEMFLHDDRTFLDEERHRAVTVWVPLVDTSPEIGNGCLEVLPGSHRMTRATSGTSTPDWFTPYDRWLARFLVPIPLHAGEALVYDSRLLHASTANRTDEPRDAILGAAVPRGVPLVHVVGTGPSRRRIHAVPREFFVEHGPADLRAAFPPDLAVLDEVVEVLPDVSLAELQALCATDETPEARPPSELSFPPGPDPAAPAPAGAWPAVHDAGRWAPLIDAVRAVAPTLPTAAEPLAGAAGRAAALPVRLVGGRGVARRGPMTSVVLFDPDRPIPADLELAPLAAAVRRVPGVRTAELVVVDPEATAMVAAADPAVRHPTEVVLVPVARAMGAAGVTVGPATRILHLAEPLVLPAGPLQLWNAGPWPLVVLVVERRPSSPRVASALSQRLPRARRIRARRRAAEQAMAG